VQFFLISAKQTFSSQTVYLQTTQWPTMVEQYISTHIRITSQNLTVFSLKRILLERREMMLQSLQAFQLR